MPHVAPELPNTPPRRLAITLIIRSVLVRILTSTRRIQGIGLAWAVLPALKRNSRDRKDLASRMHRHVYRCEVDPDTAGLLIGAIARKEMRGLGHSTPRMKSSYAPLLFHLGRDLMDRTVRPLLLALAILLLLALPQDEITLVAIIMGMLVLQNTFTWTARFAGIYWGWALEDKAAIIFSRLVVRRWTEGLKWGGAAVTGLLFTVVLFLYNAGEHTGFSPAAGLGMLIALIGNRRLHPTLGFFAAWIVGLVVLMTGTSGL